jgi:hypothetical protein
MDEVIIKLSPDRANIKATWEQRATLINWTVEGGVTDVKRLADDIRERLKRIAYIYTTKYSDTEYQNKMLPILKEIAGIGNALYDTIFNNCPDDLRVKLFAAERAGNRPVVLMKVEQKLNLHAPWGLMFSKPTLDIKENLRIDDEDVKKHFWCIKYRLATIYQTSQAFFFPAGRNDTDIDSVISLEAMKQAEGSVRELPLVGRKFVYHNWRTFLLDRQAVDRHKYLHIFCHSRHAQRNKLVLLVDNTPEKQVKVTDFSIYVSRSPKNRAQVVFLNSCDTYLFQTDTDWIKHLWRGSLRGFIGSEVELPTKDAWKFGIDLLDRLYSGNKTILEAMEDLRLKYWPLGLLYGVYADPEFKVA